MINKILVVDFGSQFNQVIIKSLRKNKVYSEMKYFKDVTKEYIESNPSIKGIILSGGPASVYDKDAYKIDNRIFDLNIPILGVCYGMQYIVQLFGGKIEATDTKEYGLTEIEIVNDSLLTKNTPHKQNVWMSHSDSITELGENLIELARTKDHISLIKHKDREIYGTQFHLEVTHTEHGLEMINNFIELTKITRDFCMKTYIEEITKEIKSKVGDKKIICAISGGVDSSVTATLLNKVIPGQIYFFFIDTGLLRHNEANIISDMFRSELKLDVLKIDGRKEMFEGLKGLTDPEEKRKAIGKAFIDIFKRTLKEFSNDEVVQFLAQGTLYSDVIESGTKSSHTIKSHHNVGGLPEDLDFELIEPLNKLFKDEVRELGRELGLSNSLVERQPFPGPGLGIRIIGEVTLEKIKMVQEADLILRNVIESAGLNKEIWQYFCVLTNTKTVGVKGDVRAYEHVLALRMVTSQDGMTADFARVDFELLAKISNDITNNVKGITRVVYDITTKPPGTIEWE